jgi:hypothetical protein
MVSPARHKAVLLAGSLLMMVLLGTISPYPKAIAVQTKSRNAANIFMVWFPSIPWQPALIRYRHLQGKGERSRGAWRTTVWGALK